MTHSLHRRVAVFVVLGGLASVPSLAHAQGPHIGSSGPAAPEAAHELPPPPTERIVADSRYELTGEMEPQVPLIIWGAAMFMGTYLTSAFVGAARIDSNGAGEALLIPFAGPLICLATCDEMRNQATVSLVLILDAILQIAGVSMVALGMVLERPVRRRRVAALELESVAVRPWLSSNAGGLAIAGRSF